MVLICYQLEPLIWKIICTSTFLFQERVLIWSMFSFFGLQGSLVGLSWQLKGEYGSENSKVLNVKKKIWKLAQNKAVTVFWLSCKILFFTNRNHWFGTAVFLEFKIRTSSSGLSILDPSHQVSLGAGNPPSDSQTTSNSLLAETCPGLFWMDNDRGCTVK